MKSNCIGLIFIGFLMMFWFLHLIIFYARIAQKIGNQTIQRRTNFAVS